MSDLTKTEKAYWKRMCAMAVEPDVCTKPVVYVSGAISPTALRTIEENIDVATIAGLKLLLCGYYPVIPHLLAAELGMEGWSRGHWMKWDIPTMLACDRVIFLMSWQSSSGAVTEHKMAEKHGMEMANAPYTWELIVSPGTYSFGLVDPFTHEFVKVVMR